MIFYDTNCTVITAEKWKNLMKGAKKFIERGGHCIYRYGFAHKGAESQRIYKEKALELLPHYSFASNAWALYYHEKTDTLEFNRVPEEEIDGVM